MAFEKIYLDIFLATVRINNKITFEDNHLDISLATLTINTKMAYENGHLNFCWALFQQTIRWRLNNIISTSV